MIFWTKNELYIDLTHFDIFWLILDLFWLILDRFVLTHFDSRWLNLTPIESLNKKWAFGTVCSFLLYLHFVFHATLLIHPILLEQKIGWRKVRRSKVGEDVKGRHGPQTRCVTWDQRPKYVGTLDLHEWWDMSHKYMSTRNTESI